MFRSHGCTVPALCAGKRGFCEGEKISDITVKGNRRIESSGSRAIKLKAGDTLYSDKTDADLRAIHKPTISWMSRSQFGIGQGYGSGLYRS